MNKVTISELDGEQYERIDNLADIRLVDSYIKSIESLQIHLMSEGFEAKEIYEYLVTLMVNQC